MLRLRGPDQGSSTPYLFGTQRRTQRHPRQGLHDQPTGTSRNSNSQMNQGNGCSSTCGAKHAKVNNLRVRRIIVRGNSGFYFSHFDNYLQDQGTTVNGSSASFILYTLEHVEEDVHHPSFPPPTMLLFPLVNALSG